MSERTRILLGSTAEVIFTALPLLIVLMVFFHADHSVRLFTSPEWSFGAAILFGQSLAKFISGIATGGHAAHGPVALVVALVVVFGLAPSLFVLYLTLESSEAKIDPAPWLQFWQVVFFGMAAVVYIVLDTIGEEWSKVRSSLVHD